MHVSGSSYNILGSCFHRVSFWAEISHRGHASEHVLIMLMDTDAKNQCTATTVQKHDHMKDMSDTQGS